MDCFTWKK